MKFLQRLFGDKGKANSVDSKIVNDNCIGCPKCGGLSYEYDGYFGDYICVDCGWSTKTIPKGVDKNRVKESRKTTPSADRLSQASSVRAKSINPHDTVDRKAKLNADSSAGSTRFANGSSMEQLFTYTQASSGEIEFVKTIIRRNPAKYGTAGGILVLDPANSSNFALLVYDFERYSVIFSITQEHLHTHQGTVAFCEMAAQNKISILDYLLKKGMNVNVRNERGVTALAIAITRGQAEAVKLLLENGADPNIVYFDSFASLQQAVEQYLIGRDQHIPLIVATYEKIVEALLASGADIQQAKRLSSLAGTADVSRYLDHIDKSRSGRNKKQ